MELKMGAKVQRWDQRTEYRLRKDIRAKVQIGAELLWKSGKGDARIGRDVAG
jgi:hypothetical protein